MSPCFEWEMTKTIFISVRWHLEDILKKDGLSSELLKELPYQSLALVYT